MLKVALTHDIDRTKKTYQYFTHSLRSALKLNINSSIYHLRSVFLKDVYWNFDEIIKIENSYNIKSTFFLLNESIPFELFNYKNWSLSLGRYNILEKRIVEIIKWLDTNGWEIGVHGSYNSFKDIELLKKEKLVLECILGHQIIGIRQHHLNLNENTWENQYLAGFKYDSSFGFNERIGFKDNRFAPFNPLNNEFSVIPQVIMDYPFMVSKNKWDLLDEIIELTEQKDAILVINWHNDKFNENEYPGFKTAYIKIIEKLKSKNAEFYKLGDYYKNCL